MDGYLAQEPVSIHHSLDPLEGSIDPEDFYVVFGSFEGEWEVVRFAEVHTETSFPNSSDGWPEGGVPETDKTVAQWSSTLGDSDYMAYVEEIKSEIAAGWVYQVNACRLLRHHGGLSLAELFSQIQSRHFAPAAGYFKSERWEIASASPETFFRVVEKDGKREIVTSPIKGTSRDGRFTAKDSAENVMIVDLMRNDISPLCDIGSVSVPRLLGVEEHPGLFHLVSDVVGELRPEVSWKRILERLSPAGSISGAPKSSALEVIRRFEPYRGAYCGTLGWIHQGQAHFSVLIRTFFKDRSTDASHTFFGTGAGITWGSDPEAEWRETELKAERLMALAEVRVSAGEK